MLNGNREDQVAPANHDDADNGGDGEDRRSFHPRGAGEDLSVIQVKAHEKGFTIRQCTLDGKVMDHVTFTPGKAVQVHQTGFKPYPGK